jgi:hypothetical protein
MRATRLAYSALAFAILTTPAVAQQPGDSVEGELVHVELRDTPRHVKVRWGNTMVQQTIANRTRIVFDPSEAGYFPNSELSDLKPGMQVAFTYTDGVLDRLRVFSVPANLRPPLAGQPRASGSAGRREVSGRLISIDDRSGEIRLDVNGRRDTYRVEDARQLRSFQVDQDVVVTLESREGRDVVTDIRTGTSKQPRGTVKRRR